MIDQVNERSIWITTHAFADEDGNPVEPLSATYRIDDVGSNMVVRDDTNFPSVTSSVDIQWQPSDTSILDETRPYETRRMTVTWQYYTLTSPSVEAQGTAEYFLNVKNLSGVTTPSPA